MYGGPTNEIPPDSVSVTTMGLDDACAAATGTAGGIESASGGGYEGVSLVVVGELARVVGCWGASGSRVGLVGCSSPAGKRSVGSRTGLGSFESEERRVSPDARQRSDAGLTCASAERTVPPDGCQLVARASVLAAG